MTIGSLVIWLSFRVGACSPGATFLCASTPGDLNDRGAPIFLSPPQTVLGRGGSSNYHKMPSPFSPFSTMERHQREDQAQNPDDTALKHRPTEGRTPTRSGLPVGRESRGMQAQQVSLSRGRGSPGPESPRRGTAPPRGIADGRPRRAPRAGSAPRSPAGVARLLPARGSGQRRPPLAPAQRGRERRAPGPEGAPGRRGRAEPQGPGRGGRAGLGAVPACARPPELCGSVCRSVRRSVGLSAPRDSGAAQRAPAKARPALTCSRCRGRLGSETGAATRVSVVGLLAARGGAVLLGSRSWEPRKKPEPRPLSPPSPLPPSPIPERSPRSLAACEARGQRGRAAGRRRRGEGGERAGRKEGCRLWGWGPRGAGAAPPCGQPRSWAPWSCAPPAATLLRSVLPPAQVGFGLQGSGPQTPNNRGFGGCGGGWGGGEHLLREGRQGRGTLS